MRDIAIIDCQISGISGDMLLSALVHAGAQEKKILQAVFACQDFLIGSKIISANFKKKAFNGFNATRFEVEYDEKKGTRKGIDMHRSLASCCDSLDLNPAQSHLHWNPSSLYFWQRPRCMAPVSTM